MLTKAAFTRLAALSSRLPNGKLALATQTCLYKPPVPAKCRRLSSLLPHVRRKDVSTVDTIYALSTAPGRAAIAIIRISGPACLDIYGALCPNKAFPTPRVAALRKVYHPTDRTTVLDTGLVLYFPAPHTVTGEDILELHVHGGPAIVRSLLAALPACIETPEGRTRRRTAEYSVIRPAEAGEFTKRAFYNDRISLPEAEALGEALSAETEQQRRLAVLGTESGLSQRYEKWRQLLLYARGEVEALIDFSEDQHFDESPHEFIASVTAQIEHLESQLGYHIKNASRGELLRQGVRVALLGAPNAGKSSLLNYIVGREAAIVSAEEGTTRDIVDVSIDLNGWLVRLGDMAGLRTTVNTTSSTSASSSSVGEIEKEGIRRARARALQSDVVIVLLALERNPNDGIVALTMNDEVRSAASECLTAGKALIIAVNKADLIPGLAESITTKTAMERYIYNALPALPRKESKIQFISCRDAAATAASTRPASTPNQQAPRDTIQPFLRTLTDLFSALTTAQEDPSPLPKSHMTPQQASSYWSASLSITHRQTTYLRQCRIHLQDFLAETQPLSPASADGAQNASDEADLDIDIVTAAEHLRQAASCLAKITGRGEGGDVEDVLGVVFEK